MRKYVGAIGLSQILLATALCGSSAAPPPPAIEPNYSATQTKKLGPLQIEVPTPPPTPVSSPAPAHDPRVLQERLDTFDRTNRRQERKLQQGAGYGPRTDAL